MFQERCTHGFQLFGQQAGYEYHFYLGMFQYVLELRGGETRQDGYRDGSRLGNGELRDYLDAIKNKMNSLEAHFDSRSGDTIRDKMNALNPTFEKYQEAVAGYVTFLREVAANFETTEQTAQKNASAFK